VAVNNTSLIVDGIATLSVTVNGTKTFADFTVTPNIDEVILGRDWLSHNDVIWKFGEQRILLHNHSIKLHHRYNSVNSCKRCTTQGDVTIPARSEAIIPTHIVYSKLDRSRTASQQWSTTLHTPVNGLRVARTLIDCDTGSTGVRVCNISDRPVRLHRGLTVSPLQPVSPLPAAQPDVDSAPDTSPSHIAPIIDKVDPTVPSGVKLQLENLLASYHDVFSQSEYDLGCTTTVQHSIDTGESRPFRQALRPQPRAHLPVIDQLLDDMQHQGVIEPCQSEWASNIVLVRKKDGSIRFCVDYRKLNSLTSKDAYPLPRIDTCLDTLSGAAWYSTFDLRSGFHQVSMDPRDANKTTFVCHRGTYRFPKMPFGLCNAPATFQRLMDTVLTGLNFDICLAYLDDIIIFSRDLDSHLERLERLFVRLREANLKLKPSKCQVMQKQVTFLGFTVCQAGVGTDPSKIEAIQHWPVPTTLRQSRAFVGLCQYYRRFVPNFSEIAAPLHALTKKGARFDWTPQCQSAFEQLKRCLTSADVLALPTDEGTFILDCDASDNAVGAVLSQVQNGEERPIFYASQLYDKHQRNYNVTRKELLAVITFVRKFRQYLLGKPFLIRSDHAALQWLKRTAEPIGQQARWLEILEEFDYTIEHRPGSKHGNADALSRIYASHTTPPTNGDPTCWPQLQQQDPQLGFVYNLIKNQLPPPTAETLAHRGNDVKTLCSQLENLTLDSNDILCRRFHVQGTSTSFLQKVVPPSLRREISNEFHKGMNGGHLGLRRAKRQLQKRFYWPGWTKDVQLAKQRCEQCARFQKPRPKHQGELHPFLTGEPWERLGIDVTGPHPTSSKGNVYILTVIDHFTKWVELFPMKNQEATTVAKILFDRVICTHGCPLQILSDRGTNFESELFQELCKLMAIDKIRTTSYQPSTNGGIERFHATMHSLIAKWVGQNHRDWDDKLPSVAFAYRTSVHESTGFTPFFLMYGREARLPADLVYGSIETDNPTMGNDFISARTDSLREAYQLTRETLGHAAQHRKRWYDLRSRPRTFAIGDLVWCLVPKKIAGRYQKWRSQYEGPFQIVSQPGPVTHVVRELNGRRTWTIHTDKLKPYSQDSVTRETNNSGGNTDPASTHETGPSRPRRHIRLPFRFRDASL